MGLFRWFTDGIGWQPCKKCAQENSFFGSAESDGPDDYPVTRWQGPHARGFAPLRTQRLSLESCAVGSGTTARWPTEAQLTPGATRPLEPSFFYPFFPEPFSFFSTPQWENFRSCGPLPT